jgi:hypothetical protein
VIPKLFAGSVVVTKAPHRIENANRAVVFKLFVELWVVTTFMKVVADEIESHVMRC